LGLFHPASGSGAELPALASRHFRLRYGLCSITVQHLAKLSNLSVDLTLLQLEAFDGGEEYFMG
jgi:hypothetical protein